MPVRPSPSLEGCSYLGGPLVAQQPVDRPASVVRPVDTGAVLRTVVPDLDRRLAQFKPVRMPFDSAALSARERQMVEQLVIACQWLESMYWRQSDPEALALYKALEPNTTPLAAKLRRYLFINGSRFDLVDENRPFVGTAPMPPGHALYPRRPDARRDRRLRGGASGQEGRALRPVHGRAPARAPTWSGRPYHEAFQPSSSSRPPTRCAGRRRSPTIRRSPRSCACAPTRCSPTTTTRATSRGSI